MSADGQLGATLDQDQTSRRLFIDVSHFDLREPALAGLGKPWLGGSGHSNEIRPASDEITNDQLVLKEVERETVPKGRLTGPVLLIEQVARAWTLSMEELSKLLGYPTQRLAEELMRGQLTFVGDEDRADRARLLYLIHYTLSDLLVESRDERDWIRNPLPTLGNVSPLDYMVSHRIPGMVAIREYVERRLANR